MAAKVGALGSTFYKQMSPRRGAFIQRTMLSFSVFLSLSLSFSLFLFPLSLSLSISLSLSLSLSLSFFLSFFLSSCIKYMWHFYTPFHSFVLHTIYYNVSSCRPRFRWLWVRVGLPVAMGGWGGGENGGMEGGRGGDGVGGQMENIYYNLT